MATTTKKPPSRSITLIRPPSPGEPGYFRIIDGKKTHFYTLFEIPCEIGGRGFVVHRLGVGTRYDVRVASTEDCSCECMGFLAHGRCKHVTGLLELMRRKKI